MSTGETTNHCLQSSATTRLTHTKSVEVNNSRDGWVRANDGGITALGGTTCPTKFPSEGSNPCTQSSFATKNVFDALQDLSKSIRGSPRPHPEAADGLLEPITHDLLQSLNELLERPEILSLHTVRPVCRERQRQLKIRALCGEVERVFNLLVDTGAQVSLVKAGLLPPECLTASRRPIRLKVANGQYMVEGTKEAEIALQFVKHRRLSCPDLGKEILHKGTFYEAQMEWDMIFRYAFMMETDSGVLLAQASMTLYQDNHLSWLSAPEHHVECQLIQPERHDLKVAALGTETVEPTYQEYGVKPEVANRVAAHLGASDVALDAFSSGASAHLRVCQKYWSAQDSAWKKDWGPYQGLMWIHCPRVDIPRAVANIRKDRSKAVFVVPMGCTKEESTRDWFALLDYMTLNKVVLLACESVYQDAKGQPMPPQRWPTEFHYVDEGLEQAESYSRHSAGYTSGGIDDSWRAWGVVDRSTILRPRWLGPLAAGAPLRRVGSRGVLLCSNSVHRISFLLPPALVLLVLVVVLVLVRLKPPSSLDLLNLLRKFRSDHHELGELVLGHRHLGFPNVG